MEEELKRSRVGYGIIVAAATIVLFAGMRAASSLLVPLLVSFFLALLFTPPLFWLTRKGVPAGLAVLIVVIALLALATGVGTLVGTSLNDFYGALPSYQSRLDSLTTSSLSALERWGIAAPEGLFTDVFSPRAIMQTVAGILSGIGGLVANAFVILLTVVFMLLEASTFPAKIASLVGDPELSLRHFGTITKNVNRYVTIKTLISICTGTVAGIWLAILGVDFPVLWGLLAFLLNYIPNIGSIIAAVPPLLLGLIQHGPGTGLAVIIGFLVINFTLGSMIEPRLMGQTLGLSTLVVFISLVFWQWILGPVGMLLSVPLTMVLKVALESHRDTRWIAVLLSSRPETLLPSDRERPQEEDASVSKREL